MSPFRASVPLTDQWRHFQFSASGGVATVRFDRARTAVRISRASCLPAVPRWQVLHIPLGNSEPDTVLPKRLDHVVDWDGYFLAVYQMPHFEEHLGYAVVDGIYEDSLDLSEFVAASVNGVMASYLHVTARNLVEGFRIRDARDRISHYLRARLSGVLGLFDHLFRPVPLVARSVRRELRYIGGRQLAEVLRGAEELDHALTWIDTNVAERNQPAKPLPALFFNGQLAKLMRGRVDDQISDLAADLSIGIPDFSPDPELLVLWHSYPCAFPGL